MVPRLRFDISWSDLARAMGYCLCAKHECALPLSRATADEAMVTLSVRSAFDLLLGALRLPAGSEVLMSDVTVPHMPRIVREHGLVPVAVPLDPRTLHIDLQALEDRLTEQSRLIVWAHLFGARTPLTNLGRLAQACDLMLIEDCAQALGCGPLARDPAADVSLFSFGPIKTATALGGGIALVKNDTIRGHMHQLASCWPWQSRLAYLARVIRISSLKLLSGRWLFTPFVGTIDVMGGDADKFVGNSARAFPDDRLLQCLRQQPAAPLERLLHYRLSHFDKSHIAERTRRGVHLATAIQPAAFAAGCDNPSHTYWVFPLVCDQPDKVVCALRRAGFDASQISGLCVVGDPQPHHWFRRTVFVPHDCQVSENDLQRAAEVIRQTVEG